MKFRAGSRSFTGYPVKLPNPTRSKPTRQTTPSTFLNHFPTSHNCPYSP